MVNVGSRALACPPFIVALRERGSTAVHGKRPRSGRGSDRFPRSGDHFPNNQTTPGVVPHDPEVCLAAPAPRDP
jgi:hypothetical protein